MDIYFLFEQLGRVTGFDSYAAKATALATDIVSKSWIESEGRFRQGVHEDGPDDAAALDQSSWGGLFAVKAAPEWKDFGSARWRVQGIRRITRTTAIQAIAVECGPRE